jgi:hypothetical protein
MLKDADKTKGMRGGKRKGDFQAWNPECVQKSIYNCHSDKFMRALEKLTKHKINRDIYMGSDGTVKRDSYTGSDGTVKRGVIRRLHGE